ncbi:hypothetical protein P3T76_001305 [Phytophthora citrophthora]|uniref:PiggyBac transposable element-derived protein domain-containing protein n=1 Tax=Phytophthora citrophthora TaxID=4793 RepID=A0AAD9GZM9_9STRA|nr:hypothetical protein P3T76_001305 [Phytophthora citrophthora]
MASLDRVPGVLTHADGSTTTKLRDSSKHYFGGSASSSFFVAFLPISLWEQVLAFTNAHALDSGDSYPKPKPIELDEPMKFLGILWYMAIYDKVEMRNYWVENDEATIFPDAGSTNLFLFIKRYQSFRDKVNTDAKRDPVAKIRPLIHMLKKRCNQHVIPGRNAAVDETSIACRFKYARHIIVYNPRKTTGKYHFKLYMCCCSTTWMVIGFKLHCSSELED